MAQSRKQSTTRMKLSRSGCVFSDKQLHQLAEVAMFAQKKIAQIVLSEAEHESSDLEYAKLVAVAVAYAADGVAESLTAATNAGMSMAAAIMDISAMHISKDNPDVAKKQNLDDLV